MKSDWFLTGMQGWCAVAVDPKDSRAVYAGATELARSTDGGETCSYIPIPWPITLWISGIGTHPKKNLFFAGAGGARHIPLLE